MLRYLRLLGKIVVETKSRESAVGRAFLVLSVLRSDARALSDYLRRRAGVLLAAAYERENAAIPAGDILERAPDLRRRRGIASSRSRARWKASPAISASKCGARSSTTFPHPRSHPTDRQLREALQTTIDNLRPALRNAMLFLGKALGSTWRKAACSTTGRASGDSERLRRDVWMFAQIVRAFATKAQHSRERGPLGGAPQLPVRPRVSRVLPRHGLSAARAPATTRASTRSWPRSAKLEDTDLVDPARLEAAVDECMAFHGYLQQLFEKCRSATCSRRAIQSPRGSDVAAGCTSATEARRFGPVQRLGRDRRRAVEGRHAAHPLLALRGASSRTRCPERHP